ncbi:hypothetical protein GCM10022214_73680 [Actinomadura miaoliensis]|uniref:Transposase IS4-like domain-containing protein n=1 Tax=Actinomadura miaoliensis TaxID=430685 RepID=A0ABP7WW63_9ACTN
MTGGNAGDCTQSTAVMATIRVPRLGPSRPRVRPDHLIADKGYSTKAIRARLREHGIGATIPQHADPDPQPGPPRPRTRLRQGRLPAAERGRTLLNRLKQWSGIATRYCRPPAPTKPPSPWPPCPCGYDT